MSAKEAALVHFHTSSPTTLLETAVTIIVIVIPVAAIILNLRDQSISRILVFSFINSPEKKQLLHS